MTEYLSVILPDSQSGAPWKYERRNIASVGALFIQFQHSGFGART